MDLISVVSVGPTISINKCLLVHLQEGSCLREYLKNTRKGNQLLLFFFIPHIYKITVFLGK